MQKLFLMMKLLLCILELINHKRLAIYKKRVEDSAVNLKEVEKVHTPWYKRIFQ